MPRLYMSEHEAVLIVIALENFISQYPNATNAHLARALTERIRACIALQGNKKSTHPKK